MTTPSNDKRNDAPAVDAASRPADAPRPRRGSWTTFYVLLAVAAILTGSLLALVIHRRQSSASPLLRASGLPASVSTSTANLMALSPVPAHRAPGFTLTDQKDHTLSLSQFRGRAVVLEFMDPHCTDICPIVSQEFIDANHDLGSLASRVAFVAVNVNQYFPSVANMAAFTREHQLNTIASWHFFTGPTPLLRRVWRDYGITVEAPNPKADILHTSLVYFIDPQGNERYVASPQVDHTASGTAFLPAPSLSAWGHGIAQVAASLVH
ncbi:MAG: SCO family protein [Acidimicrobiales bacterium]